MYSVDDRGSFLGVKSWIEDLYRADPHLTKVLVANKCDVIDSVRVRQIEHTTVHPKARGDGSVFYCRLYPGPKARLWRKAITSHTLKRRPSVAQVSLRLFKR